MILNFLLLGIVSALDCGDPAIYCIENDAGEMVFSPGFEPKYFEGQIALWQSAVIYQQDENNQARMHGEAIGCTNDQKQKIGELLKVSNTAGDWDDNTNEEKLYDYTNPNTGDSIGHKSFYGGFVDMERCMYIVNLGYSPDAGGAGIDDQLYYFQRKTVNIIYDSSIERKITEIVDSHDGLVTKTRGIQYDFPCTNTKIMYHPALHGFMWFLPQSDYTATIVIKADLSFGSDDDPCAASTPLFDYADSTEADTYFAEARIDLADLEGLSGGYFIPDMTQFLGETAYLIWRSDSGNDKVYQLYLEADASALTIGYSLTEILEIDGQLSSIASFELNGFVYTKVDEPGYYVQKFSVDSGVLIITDSASCDPDCNPTPYETGKTWVVKQADQGNHMHRPIFAINSDEVHKLYRITSSVAVYVDDTTEETDFYNFGVAFLRYRAFTLQPGDLTDKNDALNYNLLKITVVDLREQNIEQKIVVTRPGCGDGTLDDPDDTEDPEQCDDGNNDDGDGCSATCQLEDPDGEACGFSDGIIPADHTCGRWVCTTVVGELSVCTEIICGNGERDTVRTVDGVEEDYYEQCDDGNQVAGDGCYQCKVEASWDCGDNPFSAENDAYECTQRCGNGIPDLQYDWDYTANDYDTSTVIYEEVCDFGTEATVDDDGNYLGCNDVCETAGGWECEVVEDTAAGTRFSKCTQTCGDGVIDAADGEECDTGNALYNFLEMTDATTLTEDMRAEYNATLETMGYAGCSTTCQIEDGYVCDTRTPDTGGLCSSHCGNGIYEGAWESIGRTEPQLYPEEFCDDGNNDDGDGCSALCELEDEYGVTWTCEQVIDSSTYDESTGTVTIVGHTECYDCTTDDSCTSDDETLITETVVTDPSDTDSSGIYLEIAVTIPEEDCTANLEADGATTEILYMCLDKSMSMQSLTGVCQTDMTLADSTCTDHLLRYEVLNDAALALSDTLFPAAGPLFDETYVRFFGDAGALESHQPASGTDYESTINGYVADGEYTYINECFTDVDNNFLGGDAAAAYADTVFVFLFMTDGQPTGDASTLAGYLSSFENTLDAAYIAHNVRSRIYTLGLSAEQDIGFLNTLTQSGSNEGKFFYVETYDTAVVANLEASLVSAVDQAVAQATLPQVKLENTDNSRSQTAYATLTAQNDLLCEFTASFLLEEAMLNSDGSSSYTFASTVILGTTEVPSGNVEITVVESSALSLQKVLDAQILLAYLAIFEQSQNFVANREGANGLDYYNAFVTATTNIDTYFDAVAAACSGLQDTDLVDKYEALRTYNDGFMTRLAILVDDYGRSFVATDAVLSSAYYDSVVAYNTIVSEAFDALAYLEAYTSYASSRLFGISDECDATVLR